MFWLFSCLFVFLRFGDILSQRLWALSLGNSRAKLLTSFLLVSTSCASGDMFAYVALSDGGELGRSPCSGGVLVEAGATGGDIPGTFQRPERQGGRSHLRRTNEGQVLPHVLSSMGRESFNLYLFA